MKSTIYLTISIIVFVLIFTTGCVTNSNTSAISNDQKQTIKISGSTTVLPIVQTAAEQYMTTHPNTDIQVIGGGSGVGIQSISSKTVDIGMSSRELKSNELKENPEFIVTTIAKDGIAIVVNPSNNISYITLDQIKNIYTGNITKWSKIANSNLQNDNIVIIGRDSASGTRSYFDETVLLKSTPTKNMLEKNSNGAVTQTITQTPGSIGYISIGFINNNVKALPIQYNDKIISPTIDNTKTKSYPISRDLYLITNGKPNKEIQNFIDYILGPEGQKIATNEGYISI
jgi:phosphate transport system substrate-binding protein